MEPQRVNRGGKTDDGLSDGGKSENNSKQEVPNKNTKQDNISTIVEIETDVSDLTENFEENLKPVEIEIINE